MSEHFKRTIKLIVAIVVLSVATYFWLKHRIHDVLVPPRVTLPSKDKELITYNENRHTITITTAKGTIQKYSRNPTVEIRKDGTVKVNSNSWGWETRPFLGVGYSDTPRVYTGCNLFYFHQFDAGASFGWTGNQSRAIIQPLLSLSWNFWSNTSIGVGVNPLTIGGWSKPEPALFLSVKL